MDSREFRRRGREVIDFIIDYHRTISERRIMASEDEGYLKELLPDSAPIEPESFDEILNDMKSCIMPGIVNWRHPRSFSWFPYGSSYPSVLADMLISAINCAGFSWAAGPSCTELEIVTLDWLGRMIGLPEAFLNSSGDRGGGAVLHVSAVDALLVSMIAARHEKTREQVRKNPTVDKRTHLPLYVIYCSSLSYTRIKRAVEVAMFQIRLLEVDDKFQLRGETLSAAMSDDLEKGLIPIFVFANLGSNAYCACDAIEEIGPVCEKFNVWLHVDAAYVGCASVCPEFQHFLKGIQFVQSICIDPSMWMLVNFDCCALWIQDRCKLTNSLSIDPTYLQHTYSDSVIDYRHWGIPLSRRFRALKLWFVLRSYGVEGVQAYIRKHVQLAKTFENFVRNDDRFVVENEVNFGRVPFRLKCCSDLNKKLLSKINESGKIFLIGSMIDDKFIIQFGICSENSEEEDILFAWETISEIAQSILSEENAISENRDCLTKL